MQFEAQTGTVTWRFRHSTPASTQDRRGAVVATDRHSGLKCVPVQLFHTTAPYTSVRDKASGTSFSVPRCAQLAAFGTMSYARVAGRLARTEEGSGVSALSSTQRLAVASALHRIARDPVIRPALLQAMGKTAHGVPDAVSPR